MLTALAGERGTIGVIDATLVRRVMVVRHVLMHGGFADHDPGLR